MEGLNGRTTVVSAEELHRQLLVVNGVDACPFDEVLIQRLRKGGVTCNVVHGGTTAQDFEELLLFIRDHSDEVMLAKTVKEIREAKRLGKVAIVFNWQHCNALGSDEHLLASFQQLGISICNLCYNVRNLTGDGCTERTQCGLSLFGERVVREINRLRLVLDIGGHTSESTSWDALKIARGPVICSHTNCRALRDNPRCMTDDLMRAIAARGGVIGMTCYGHFLTDKGNASLDTFLDHVDHAVQTVGADHVGIALDQIQYPQPPPSPLDRYDDDPYVSPAKAYPENYFSYTKGLETAAHIPNITAGLLARGYSPADVTKVMGENWLRVYEQVWGA
jgi:membrane dipeptidase